jgi:epoxyqueuosine reductase
MSERTQYSQLLEQIRDWARELGFAQVGVSGVDLGEHPAYLERWLDAGYHGEMHYMAIT